MPKLRPTFVCKGLLSNQKLIVLLLHKANKELFLLEVSLSNWQLFLTATWQENTSLSQLHWDNQGVTATKNCSSCPWSWRTWPCRNLRACWHTGLLPEPLITTNGCFSPRNPSGHQWVKAWLKKYIFGSGPEAAVDIVKHRSASNKSHSIYKAFPRRQIN